MPNYGDPKYWDDRYSEQQGTTFDWLENFESLRERLVPLIPGPDAKILVLGCGNAEFSEDMYEAGFHNISNIDISSVVIDQMRERNSARVEMTFEVMDVRKLAYPNDTFDLAVDKSTIDALLCGEQSFLNVARMTREVQRVLKVGGYYAAISYGVPENRSAHFTWSHLNWTYSNVCLNDPDDDRDSKHYLYLCKKVENWLEADAHWPEVETELYENEEEAED